VDLLSFAMLTFVLAPINIKAKLVGHFMFDSSARYMVDCYTGKNKEQWAPRQQQPSGGGSNGGSGGGGAATQLPAAAAGMLALQQLAQAAAERSNI
jgi:hypothetical protein